MVEELIYQGIEFPVSTKDYTKIEVQHSINVNVFAYEDKQFYPIFISRQHNNDVLNLLLITEGEKKHVQDKDFNRMMYNNTNHQYRKHFCMHCLQCFSTEEILTKHNENCMVINGGQAIRMPQKGKNTLQFQNHHRQMPYLLLYTQILRLLLRRYKDASLVALNLILTNTKSILAGATGTK